MNSEHDAREDRKEQSPPEPVDCECAHWARSEWRAEDLLNHHPRCAKRKDYDGVREFAADVVRAMRYWGAQEDGVPDDPKIGDIYRRAVSLSGMDRALSPKEHAHGT